ncbi:hypothetical protein FGB62_52g114 [Gracilaria domingensis]|nr:hypothetical protein FGB62_52g114 [Gracilaria domingensis]
MHTFARGLSRATDSESEDWIVAGVFSGVVAFGWPGLVSVSEEGPAESGEGLSVASEELLWLWLDPCVGTEDEAQNDTCRTLTHSAPLSAHCESPAQVLSDSIKRI